MDLAPAPHAQARPEAVLEVVRSAIARLSLIEAEIVAAIGGGAAPADPAPLIDADLVPVSVAAFEMRRSDDTLRRWCREHDLGSQIGGRWYVSRDRLRGFIAGRRV